MTRAPASLETEAKFDVLDRRAARGLLGAAGLAGLSAMGSPRSIRLTDQYLDTADGRLRRAGWAARLRTAEGVSRIQLKRLGMPGADGVQRRAELDGPADPSIEPSAWPRSAARRRLLQLLAGGTAEQTVTLRQDRLARDFADGASRVELSLDRIAVIADNRVAGRHVIMEVELRAGTEAGLGRALAALRLLPFLTPASVTKLAWASAIGAHRTRAEALPTIGDEDLPPRADEPTSEVGRRILRTQLRRLVERERTFLGAAGPEEIRRMRVATRRLRATWRAFSGTYAGRVPERLRRRLGRLADVLSAVRDLDVLAGRVEAYRGGLDQEGSGALAGLVATIEARRSSALGALHSELAAPRHRAWLDGFVDFVETPGRGAIQTPVPAPRRLNEQVGGWIWSGFERLLAWEPLVGVADAVTLHELRLETKRLRDVIQVTAPMASAPADGVLASLVRLQDALGALNDATVAAEAARGYLRRDPADAVGLTADERSATEAFAVAQDREAERLRRRVPAAWRAATSPVARRRLARLIGSF